MRTWAVPVSPSMATAWIWTVRPSWVSAMVLPWIGLLPRDRHRRLVGREAGLEGRQDRLAASPTQSATPRNSAHAGHSAAATQAGPDLEVDRRTAARLGQGALPGRQPRLVGRGASLSA